MRLAFALALVAMATLPVAAGAETRSEPRYTQSVTETVRLPTPWGTIFGKVRRPVVPPGVRVPVILEYTPYTGDDGAYADDSVGDFYVPRGYARAVFDLPGTSNSTGCWDFGGPGERQAGLAVIDHLRSQPWSDGKLGMYGSSYPGATALMLSGAAGRKVSAVFAAAPPDRWYDYDFQNGVRTPYMATPFPLFFPVTTTLTGVGADGPQTIAENLASRLRPCQAIELLLQSNSFDPQFTDFWRERDYRRYAAKAVSAPTLISAGLGDNNVKHDGAISYFNALPDDVPKRLLLNQGGHVLIPESTVEAVAAWFDEHLLGLDAGATRAPRVEVVNSAGERRTGDGWPLATVGKRRLDFGRELTREGPSASWTNADDSLCDDRTGPMFAAAGGLTGRFPVCTADQTASTSVAGTYVRWRSEPFPAATEIAGRPVVDLTLVSDTERAQVAVTLFDVDPAGRATVLTNGFVSSRAREGVERSVPLTPGEPWRARVPLWDIDSVVPAGHRIVVSVAAMNSHYAWPTTDEAGLSRTALVEPRSTLTLPVLGAVKVKGPADAPVLPASRRCLSQRHFKLRLRGSSLRSALVRVDGRRVPVRRRAGLLVATVDLRARDRRRVQVVAIVRSRDGTTLRDVRTYRTCLRKSS